MIAALGVPEQVLVGVITGIITLSIPVLIRLVAKMHNDVHDIKGVLITPKPTGLVPYPPQGLVDVVAGLAYTAAANLTGTGALVTEKAGNGSPIIDAAKVAIEAEQARTTEATKEIP